MRIRITLLAILLIHCNSLHAAGIVADSSLNSGVRHIEVWGDHAFCAMASGILIYDVSIPSQPEIVSVLHVGPRLGSASLLGIAIRYPYCYYSNDQLGLFVVDVTNLATPVVVGHYMPPGSPRGIAIHDNHLLVGVKAFGLSIVDVSVPESPTLAANLPLFGLTDRIAIRDTIAFVTDGDLIIVNIANPQAPEIVGSFSPPIKPKGIHVEGNYAYLGDPLSGYFQVDITDIANPKAAFQFGSLDDGPYIWDVDVVGQIAYGVGEILGSPQTILCFSTVAPTSTPSEINLGSIGYGIHVEQNIIYVCCHDAGLITLALQWRGDVNATEMINAADIVFLANYVFKSGTPPTPANAGDANCDGVTTTSDVIYLVNYVFRGGDQPVCPE